MIERFLKGLRLSSAIVVVTLLAQVVSVPILLASWGPSVFGEWLVLTSMASALSVLNLGVQSYAANRMIEAFATGKLDAGTRVLNSALRLYSLLCAVAMALVLGITVSPRFMDWLNVVVISSTEARLIVLFYGLLAAYSIIGGLLMAILRSINEQPRQLAYGLVERIFVLCAPLTVALLGGTPLVAALLVTAAMFAVAFVAVRDVAARSPFRIGIAGSSWNDATELIRPSLSFFGVGVTWTVLITALGAMLSHELGAAAVALFSVTLMLTNILRLVLQQGLNVLWPEITAAASRGSTSTLVDWYKLCMKLVLGGGIAAGIGVALIGPDVLRAWTSGRIDVSATLNLLLVGHFIVQLPALVGGTFGLALNRQQPLMKVQATASLLTLITGWAMTSFLRDPSGAAIALIAGQALASASIVRLSGAWLGSCRPGLGAVRRAAAGLLLPFAAAAFVAHASPDTASRAVLTVLLVMITLWGLWVVWLTPAERRRIGAAFSQSGRAVPSS